MSVWSWNSSEGLISANRARWPTCSPRTESGSGRVTVVLSKDAKPFATTSDPGRRTGYPGGCVRTFWSLFTRPTRQRPRPISQLTGSMAMPKACLFHPGCRQTLVTMKTPSAGPMVSGFCRSELWSCRSVGRRSVSGSLTTLARAADHRATPSSACPVSSVRRRRLPESCIASQVTGRTRRICQLLRTSHAYRSGLIRGLLPPHLHLYRQAHREGTRVNSSWQGAHDDAPSRTSPAPSRCSW